MKIKISFIALVLLVCFSSGFTGKCGKGQNPEDIPLIRVYSDTLQKTADGTTVASKFGVSADVLETVKNSLSELFEDARARGYQNNLDPAAVIIYALHDCGLSPESRTPSFLLRADNYDGTSFDQYNPKGAGVKDGVGQIYAAEYVIFEQNGAMSQEYVICSQAAGVPVPMDYVFNVARYGKEHRILYDNDLSEYYRTATHTDASNSHPLIPSRAPGVSAEARRASDVADFGGFAEGRTGGASKNTAE